MPLRARSRATTDALDAQRLAQFAAERQPPAWTPPPAVSHALRPRLRVRDGLLAMRQQARNQRHARAQWLVVIADAIAHRDPIIAEIATRLTTRDADLTTVLRDGAWAASATLLASIPGIGPITTAWLLVATVNVQTGHTADQLPAYAGLVPRVYESGTRVRRRAQLGHGGHTRLRTARSMASRSASHGNPVLRPVYERLRANPPRLSTVPSHANGCSSPRRS